MNRKNTIILVSAVAFVFIFLAVYFLNSKFHFLADTNALNYYVATNGNDNWSGVLKAPNSSKTDGPFATLDRARDKIREMKASAPITLPVTVNLRQGSYLLSKPFSLDERDSGSSDNPITYQSYPGEKATLTSGVVVKPTWQKYKDNIYVTDIDPTMSSFNSLFVDGLRATRARTANNIPTQNPFSLTRYDAEEIGTNGNTSFAYNQGDVNSSWTNIQDMQVVALERWLSPRFFVRSIDDKKVTIQGKNFVKWVKTDAEKAQAKCEFCTPEGVANKECTVCAPGEKLIPEGVGFYANYPLDMYKQAIADGSSKNIGNSRYYIDNVFEALDVEGEWYFYKSEHKLFYYPLKDTQIQKSTFVIPSGTSLVDVSSSSHYKIRDGFSLSAWIKTTNGNTEYLIGNAGSGEGYRFGLSGGKMHLLIGDYYKYDELSCGQRKLNDDSWHMITANFDLPRKTVSCYADGALERAINISDSYPAVRDTLPGLGRVAALAGFVGTADELNMYSKVLSEDEITRLYKLENLNDSRIFGVSFDESVNDLSGVEDAWSREFVLNKTEGLINGGLVDGVKGPGIIFNGSNNISFTGDYPEKYQPSNIKFENMNFAYTDWKMKQESYFTRQAGYIGMFEPGVSLNGTKQISVSSSSFSGLGECAVSIDSSRGVKLNNNRMYDLGSCGVMVKKDRLVNEGAENQNIISDNAIHDVGRIFADGGIGVFLAETANNLITQNTIFNASYSGISSGYTWSGAETMQKNNIIDRNIIHDVMQVLDDGGGIYVSGRQNGSIFQNNIIYNVIETPQNPKHNWLLGFYTDSNTAGITVKNNLISNTGIGLWIRHFSDSKAQNNIVYNPTSDKSQINIPGKDMSPKNVEVTNNIIFQKEGQKVAYNLLPTADLTAEYHLDNNLFDNRTSSLDQLATLRSVGQDTHSVVGQAKFRDPAKGNFCLSDSSDALALGFVAFNNCQIPTELTYSLVGPQINYFTKGSLIGAVNVSDNQTIATNPYILSVKVKDASRVEKVEYYIDNILIGTATLPDVNGVFDWPWDTSKYHSIVKIIVYGTDGQTEEITRNTTVELSGTQNNNDIVVVLPKTGENSKMARFVNFLTSILGDIKTAF